jgi:hypothetical protein
MDGFRFGKAWSLGYALVARGALHHAILLIGLGILAPMALQFAMLGTLVGAPNASLMGGAGAGFGEDFGASFLIALLLGYVFQAASYFASLRIGLGREGSLGRALLFALPAGLMAVAILSVAAGVAGVTFVQMMAQPALALLLGILAAAPVILAAALFYTLISAIAAVGVVVTLLLLMMIGAATGNIGMAATLVGGSGAVVVVLIALGLVWLWLTARLSCAASIMAERKSFNLAAAIRESWRLTWEEQWGILRYLALLGLAVVLVLLAAMVVIGLGAAATLQFGAVPEEGMAVLIGMSLLVGVPLAYLGVMVPGGIFRSLHGVADEAEVFA